MKSLHLIIILSGLMTLNSAQAGSAFCSSEQAKSTIEAAMQEKKMKIEELVQSIDNNFKTLLKTSQASRVKRIAQNPRLLKEDLKLSICLAQYFGTSSEFMQNEINNYNELFDSELKAIDFQQPIVASEQNGLALERENLNILKEYKETVSSIRALNSALNKK